MPFLRSGPPLPRLLSTLGRRAANERSQVRARVRRRRRGTSSLAPYITDSKRELLGIEVFGERNRELARGAGQIFPLLRVDRAVLVEEREELSTHVGDGLRVHDEIRLHLDQKLLRDQLVERDLPLRLAEAERSGQLLRARRLDARLLELREDRLLHRRERRRLRRGVGAASAGRCDEPALLEARENRIVGARRQRGGKLGAQIFAWQPILGSADELGDPLLELGDGRCVQIVVAERE